ncbi:DUF3306 domain-containing protein [Rhodospirillaceae bacterium SYSU D60014]|uniref:DUF3306 domain-containing protein n=1 Tax=Virgifigura deserti TaxID=2268457 RepID=UPI000E672408
MTEERQGFLERWSRLKQARGAGDSSAEPKTAPPEEQAVPATAETGEGEAAADQGSNPPDLPPIESLDKDSDFTAFMKEGIPEETKRLALRTLWRSDPVLANLDGLLEYGEDFSAPWKTTGVVATVYRVGKGMPDLLERLAKEVEDGDAPKGEEEVTSQAALCIREETPVPDNASEASRDVETADKEGSEETPSQS